jgi:hypothetical protein
MGVGVRFPAEIRFFSSPQRPDDSGAHPASYPVGIGGGGGRGRFPPGYSSRGVKLTTPPSSAEVKKGGAIPPLPICLHGVVIN